MKMVVSVLTGSRHQNQPHLRQVVVGDTIVSVVKSVAVMEVIGTVVVMVVFVVTGSRQLPNQPHWRQVVVEVVIVSVVSADVADVVVLSSWIDGLVSACWISACTIENLSENRITYQAAPPPRRMASSSPRQAYTR